MALEWKRYADGDDNEMREHRYFAVVRTHGIVDIECNYFPMVDCDDILYWLPLPDPPSTKLSPEKLQQLIDEIRKA